MVFERVNRPAVSHPHHHRQLCTLALNKATHTCTYMNASWCCRLDLMLCDVVFHFMRACHAYQQAGQDMCVMPRFQGMSRFLTPQRSVCFTGRVKADQLVCARPPRRPASSPSIPAPHLHGSGSVLRSHLPRLHHHAPGVSARVCGCFHRDADVPRYTTSSWTHPRVAAQQLHRRDSLRLTANAISAFHQSSPLPS